MGTFQVGLLLIGTFALLLALSVPLQAVAALPAAVGLDMSAFVRAAVAAARWFCANTVWITLTARRMSAVMGYRCNRT